MNYSHNAIFTKARAMYGKLLDRQNYEQLINSQSVNEIAAYLRTKTDYASAFENTTPTEIHRGRLEILLRRHVLKNCAALANYQKILGMKFYRYFITKDEIKVILEQTNGYKTSDLALDFLISDFTNKNSDLDFEAILKAQNFPQLVDALNGTEYYPIVEPLLKTANEIHMMLDVILTGFLNRRVKLLVEKELKGKTKDEVIKYLSTVADLKRLTNLMRIKKHFNNEKLIPIQIFADKLTLFTDKQIEEILYAENEEELLKVLNKTEYKKVLFKDSSSVTEGKIEKYIDEISRENLVFSTNPVLVMLCYIHLAESELENITRITEGVRYGLSPEEIYKLIELRGE